MAFSRMVRFFGKHAASLYILLQIMGCDLFNYNPHNLMVDYRNLNQKNYAKVSANKNNSKNANFRFALISDSHHQYDKLEILVRHLNGRHDLEFVIVMGDITKYGQVKEYKWFYDIIKKLDVPFIVIPGNHDCQGNGKEVFSLMFGPYDDVFTYKNTKFVFANQNVWEFGDNVPNYIFLDTALAPNPGFEHIIYLSHVPTFGDQMPGQDENKVLKLLKYAGVKLAIFGHTHHWEYIKAKPGEEINYLIVDDVTGLNYALVTITGKEFSITRELVND